MKNSKVITDFEHGVFYAAGLLVTFIDEPVIAADIISEAGLSHRDISLLDEYERDAMKILMRQDKRINFTGVELDSNGD